MKARWVAIFGIGLLALANSALAGPWGCGCNVQGSQVSVEAVKKFQDETTALRNDMMIKKVELRNEYLKQPVDTNRVAALTKEITDLQNKINTIATNHGLPGPGGGFGMSRGWGMRFASQSN